MKKLHQQALEFLRKAAIALRGFNERRKSRLAATDFGLPFSRAQFVQPLGKID
ncbi:MAG: hypothetical protein AAGA58_08430 [Verrucomicrobiota bacterium]